MPQLFILKLLCLSLLLTTGTAAADVKRIATLAPHLTEWVYSLGLGDNVVAISAYSDYPEQASKHPIIADANGINLAKLIELKPDLVLVWQSNAKLGQIEKMKKMGLNIFISNPHTLEDISAEITQLGSKLGQEKRALKYVTDFENNIRQLEQKYAKSETKPAFFQLWHTPIMTVNGNTMISQILNLCGLENVFSESKVNYPTVTKEQVMLKKPEYIIVSATKNTHQQTSIWHTFNMIPAVKNKQIINLNPDHLHRYTHRVLIAAKELCESLN